MKTFLCSHLVRLRWSGRETAGNLEKISAGLATVNAEEALPIGAAVLIFAGLCELGGTVVRSKVDPLGYFIEVALDREWSPELFMPDHFFDCTHILEVSSGDDDG
jgi:hypothetical protein